MVRDLVSQFIVEARAGQFEYARVLADFTSAEENALQLSAGEIVAVVPKVHVSVLDFNPILLPAID